jgi:hypothetical protein
MDRSNYETQFDFDDDKPQEFLVCYRGGRYILTEASAATGVNFRNANLKAAQVQFTGSSVSGARMEGGAESELILLSGCLFQTLTDNNAPPHLRDKDGKGFKVKRDRDGNGVAVPIHELRGWGSKITRPLFDKAKEISHLGETEIKPSNGKPDTTTNHDDTAECVESDGTTPPKDPAPTMTYSP